MKSVDVDALLAESELELRLGGKTYKIRDVPLTTFMKISKEEAKKDPELPHKQLGEVLGVDPKELKKNKVGLKAVGLALGEIMKWLADRKDEDEALQEAKSKSKNP